MILFFKGTSPVFYAVDVKNPLPQEDIEKLCWLFGDATAIKESTLSGYYIGPRREMITPWSTNAVEITQNMGIDGILRIEELMEVEGADAKFDHMLQRLYTNPGQEIFTINHQPEPIVYIENIDEYNRSEGLALSADEVAYLDEVSQQIGRKLTDSEVFGFSQVNSEHCRHKIFNGTFVIDGVEKEKSLFQLIKRTSQEHPGRLVSAYKDNVAFIDGPKVEQFAPATHDKPDFFQVKDIDTVISLKAETHNFPTTVEPFNGAATGTGGEIRDRLAGGKGSLPIAGTAVYMTSYPRTEANRQWEQATEPRPWLYQTPEEILVKASNGASDFGNKFGQPLICGSVLTFEHFENAKKFGFDKVIMLAGGIGWGKKQDSLKGHAEVGDKVVVMGGDNYRIGMGGGAVSSVATGEYDNSIELNAVQRSNPEMQKRAANAIRAIVELDENPIVSIHDHGAGGHLNALSELVEEKGGKIDITKLPVGDPTLSAKEIVGNESQERMGLLIKDKDAKWLKDVSDRERAPMYVVGEITGDMRFSFENPATGEKPIDLKLEHFFGKPPRTYMRDASKKESFASVTYEKSKIQQYIEQVLQLEAVACKDWLTNKVDRSVTGKIALQQCAGPLQLPLNNLGVVALDYQGERGIATSIGHAPAAAMVNPANGSRLSIAEALTNLVWAPIEQKLSGVSLSANWMWPCKNEGEDARLYEAVQAVSDFSIELGVNIPTGKDSLSMTQKYKNGDMVYSPGTVIISTVGEVTNIRKVVSPALENNLKSSLIYVDFSKSKFSLGGSSFAQVVNRLGEDTPTVDDAKYFATTFNTLQDIIASGDVLAGHDISAGGLLTALLEMTFSHNNLGLSVDLSAIGEKDIVKVLFSEKPSVILQVANVDSVAAKLQDAGVSFALIGAPKAGNAVEVALNGESFHFDVMSLRDKWFKTSYLLDRKQSGEKKAAERFENYKKQERLYKFDKDFTGTFAQYGINPKRRTASGVKAAIIREKGSNGDREMAYSLYLAGFDVKDVHMTDLITGRETLEDVSFIVFVGGFSNSDVLGSAKGWAGAFLYNPKAKEALDKFYARKDTLSLGVCNGCQLMAELGLIYPEHEQKHKMLHNDSHKFESTFLTIDVPANNSVLFGSLSGSTLGIWVAHGEGKFAFPYEEGRYNIVAKYSYEQFPGNPNGSMFNTAAVASADGRHLAIMPHFERSIFPWHWPHYPAARRNEDVTPWIEPFVNALEWIKKSR